MIQSLRRVAAVLTLGLAATAVIPAGAATAAAGLTVDARRALLSADRTQVVLVGSYSCGPFAGGVPERGVIDLGVNQVVAGFEVRAIGYLEPTRCDGASHDYAVPLETVEGTLRRAAATWSASGYVEGDAPDGGFQHVHVPPSPIRLR
jgi:hypothetical protein